MNRWALPFAALLCTSCALGPNYRRPSTAVTRTFRGAPLGVVNSFADLPWWEVLRDPALSALLRRALANNYDLADAIARVEVARQNAKVSTDQLLPSLSVSGGPSYQQVFSPLVSEAGAKKTTFRYATYSVEGAVSWEVDLWGRLRRLRQAALANFLASQDNERDVIVSLIAQVAEGYYNLVALDLQRQVAERTVASRRETLRLFAARERGGVGDRLQTSSEEANLADALATLPRLDRQIAQQENQLAFLVGQPPGPIERTRDFLSRPPPPDPPVGLPAALLERRPDVRRAEANVVAANAEVGAAFARLFPQVTLSASGGLEASSLASLFASSALTFGVGLLVNWLAPLLNGAEYAHQYRGQQAAFRAVVADYRRAVLNALTEVANTLAASHTLREERKALEDEVRLRNESVKLAKDRFVAGVASYLDVVQAEQNLFPVELTLAQTVGAQFTARAQLYRALGGGWRTTDAPRDR